MSRTTTTKYRQKCRLPGFLYVILGQFIVLAALLCFSVQNAVAQMVITPDDVSRSDSNATDTPGLVIGGNDIGIFTGDYWSDTSGNRNRLVLGETFNVGGIYVINNSRLTFRNGLDDHGGAILITSPGRTFTFSGGVVGGYIPTSAGGGSNSSGTFEFVNNVARQRGGAIFNNASTLRLSVLFFRTNEARGEGGGAIYNEGTGGNITYWLTTFTGNFASGTNSASGGLGGGIYNRLGTMTFNALWDTGGWTYANYALLSAPFEYVYNYDGSTLRVFAHNRFNNNWAVNSGGAIYNRGGTIDFNSVSTNGTLNDSYTWNGNGNNGAGTWTISGTGGGTRSSHNLFVGNQARGGSGGAIFSDSGRLTFTGTTTPNSGTNSITVNANHGTAGHINNTMGAYYTYAQNTFASGGTFANNWARDYGGAIFSGGTMTFGATANFASATANATANANQNGSSPWAEAYTYTLSEAYGGHFSGNNVRGTGSATASGGAIYSAGGSIAFTATANAATAESTANSTADGQNNQPGRRATALAEARAEAIATSGFFTRNTAGQSTGGNYDGLGGAIFAQGGTITFGATAQAARATANANPTSTRGGNGNSAAGANATARALSRARGAEFTDNQASRGGAIFNDRGTLTFEATITPSLGSNAYASANPTPSAQANGATDANDNFDLLNPTTLITTAGGFPGTMTQSSILSVPFWDPADPLYGGGVVGRWFGSRAYAESTAYGATFRDNKATLDGGALYNEGGTLQFITVNPSTTVTAHSTGSSRDGVAIPGGNVTETNDITTKTRAGNFTQDWFTPVGWYSWRYGQSVALADVAAAIFENNTAGRNGGAIYVTQHDPAWGLHTPGFMEVVGITRFDRNVAGSRYVSNVLTYTGGGEGGAIYNDRQTVTFMATTNTAGTLSTGYSTFTNNIAERGGALFNLGEAILDAQSNVVGTRGEVSFWNINTWEQQIANEDRFSRNANLVGVQFGVTPGTGNIANYGGAIYNTEHGTINVANGHFFYNQAQSTVTVDTIPLLAGSPHIASFLGMPGQSMGGGDGGAIYNEGGVINLYGGLFTNNRADGSGGAIYHTNPKVNPNALVLIDSTGFAGGIVFEDNRAGLRGGAVFSDDVYGRLDFTNVRFKANQTQGEGAAVWSVGTATFIDNVFEDNNSGMSVVPGLYGGAIFNTARANISVAGGGTERAIGRMTFHNAEFTGNLVDNLIGFGGAIYNEGGALTFSGNTSFSRNTGYTGGAIYNEDGTILMAGGIFGQTTGNSATLGGAIYNMGIAGNATVRVPMHNAPAFELTDRTWDGYTIRFVDTAANSNPATAVRVALTEDKVLTVTYNSGNTAHTYEAMRTALNDSWGVDGTGNPIKPAGLTDLTWDATFVANPAARINASLGGRDMVLSKGGYLGLTNVSFYRNVANNNGGAIFTENGRIDLNVTASSTSTFRYNVGTYKASADSTSESIYFRGAENILNVDIASNGRLNMYNPMTWANNTNVNINKTGAGTWLLAGHNAFATGTGKVDFTFNEGTLEFINHDFGADVGTAVAPNHVSTQLRLGTGTFTVGSSDTPATLSMGLLMPTNLPPLHILKDNYVIEASNIMLHDNTTFVFHLNEEDFDRNRLNNPDHITGNNTPNNPYAILTLIGNTTDTTAIDGFSVEVHLSGGSNLPGGLTWLDWFEVTNDHQVLLVNDATGMGKTAINTQDVRVTIDGTLYQVARGTGGMARPFVLADGWLKFEDIPMHHMDLYWTGVQKSDGAANSIWNLVADNWYGSRGSVEAHQFFTGDRVKFENAYQVAGEASPRNVTNKNVSIGTNVEVGTMDVGGTGYIFSLAPGATLAAKNIPGVSNTGYIDFGTGIVNVSASTSTATIRADTSITFANTGGIRFDMSSVTAANYAPGAPAFVALTANNIAMNNSTHLLVQSADQLLTFLDTTGFTAGSEIKLIETTGDVSGLGSVVRDSGGSIFVAHRASNGILYRFVVNNNDLFLRGEAAQAGWNLDWTGTAVGNNWNTTSTNWLGHYVGNSLNPNQHTNTFMQGDWVRFADRYNTASTGSPEQWVTVNALNKQIVIGSDVNVLGMNVTGHGYVFSLAPGTELDAAQDINFGTARVNFSPGASVSANGDIYFDDQTNILGGNGDRAGIGVFGTATIAATNIYFTGDNDYEFILTPALIDYTTNSALTLQGDVVGQAGNGKITVNGLPTTFSEGDWVTLVTINGDGDVTADAELWIGTTQNTPRRSTNATDTMLGLGTSADQKQLLLKAVSAAGNTDLYWTGNTSSVWNVNTATNWTGMLNGIRVTTFMNGDLVIFDNSAANKDVVTAGVMTVGSMEVQGNDYRFDLRTGGITAIATTWRDGTVTDGSINFGDGDTTIVSGIGTTISTEGTMTFGTGTIFEFDLAGTNAGDTYLTLLGDVIVAEQIGSYDIYVNNLPNLAAGSRVTLVDTGTTLDVLASTGDLYVNGSLQSTGTMTRNPTLIPGNMMVGLGIYAETQLYLEWVDATTNTDRLTWTGIVGETGKNGWGVWDVATTQNWRGRVANLVDVTTFLDGDTVYFDDTAVRKGVTLTAGGVWVNSMFVEATGYQFDLTKGGIAALGGNGNLGRIELNDATLIVALSTPLMPGSARVDNLVIVGDEITVDGTRLVVETLEIDRRDVRNSGGEIEFEILLSKESPISGSVNPEVELVANPYYTGTFFIDNETSRGYGVLRLKEFSFTDYAWSYNTFEAAGALDFLRDALAEGSDESRALFTRFASDPHEAASMLRGTELVADALATSFWNPWEITHRRMRTSHDDTGLNTWGEGYFRAGKTSSDGNAVKYDSFRMGTMVGADFGSHRSWLVGAAFGYGMPSVTNEFGKVEADDVTLGLYSRINLLDQAQVTSFFGYGYQTYTMNRTDFANSYRSRFNGDSLYASMELTKNIQSPPIPGVEVVTKIIPLIALDHQTAWTKGFSETGYLGQSVAGASMSRTMARVGVDSQVHVMDTLTLSTRLQTSFLIDGDNRPTVVSYFPGTNASMSLRGVDMGWMQFNLGASVSGMYRGKYQWFMDLDGYASGRTTAAQGQIGLSTRW